MDRFILPLAIMSAIVVVAYRHAATRCREVESRRPWFIAGAVAAIILAGLLVPWLLAKLDPPYSESPAGVFVYLGKAVVVGLLGLGGLGILIGAIFPGRPGHST